MTCSTPTTHAYHDCRLKYKKVVELKEKGESCSTCRNLYFKFYTTMCRKVNHVINPLAICHLHEGLILNEPTRNLKEKTREESYKGYKDDRGGDLF